MVVFDLGVVMWLFRWFVEKEVVGGGWVCCFGFVVLVVFVD